LKQRCFIEDGKGEKLFQKAIPSALMAE